MKPNKILKDLITSAISSKAHFEVWWAQASEAKPGLVAVMNTHSDFFHASADAPPPFLSILRTYLTDDQTHPPSQPISMQQKQTSIRSNYIN